MVAPASLSHKQLLAHVTSQKAQIDALLAGMLQRGDISSPKSSFVALNKTKLLALSQKLQADIAKLTELYNSVQERARRAAKAVVESFLFVSWFDGVTVRYDPGFDQQFCWHFEQALPSYAGEKCGRQIISWAPSDFKTGLFRSQFWVHDRTPPPTSGIPKHSINLPEFLEHEKTRAAVDERFREMRKMGYQPTPFRS